MNPHTFFYIDVTDEKTKKVTNWAMEMGSPNGLMRQGWTRNSMKVGDIVTVEGSLAKDGSPTGNARSVHAERQAPVRGVEPGPDPVTEAISDEHSSYRAVRRGGGGRVFIDRLDEAQAPAPRPRRRPRRAAQGGGAAVAAAAMPARRSPTPRLPDGTVNLGRVPGEKGTWSVPYITNMAMRVVTGPGSDELRPGDRGPAGGAGGGPRRRRRRAWRWRRRRPRRREVGAVDALDAVVGGGLRLPLEERVEVRPGRLLPPAGRPAHDGDAVPGGDHPAAGAQADHHDLRRRDAHLARDLHGRPLVPRGRRAQPDLPRLLDRPLGRRHARRREQGLQREQLARLLRPPAHGPDGW